MMVGALAVAVSFRMQCCTTTVIAPPSSSRVKAGSPVVAVNRWRILPASS